MAFSRRQEYRHMDRHTRENMTEPPVIMSFPYSVIREIFQSIPWHFVWQQKPHKQQHTFSHDLHLSRAQTYESSLGHCDLYVCYDWLYAFKGFCLAIQLETTRSMMLSNDSSNSTDVATLYQSLHLSDKFPSYHGILIFKSNLLRTSEY